MGRPYSPQFNKSRRIAFERDGYECRKCGFYSRSTEGLQAHHIVPRVDGGDDTPENLMTLCRLCHGEWTWVAKGFVDLDTWLEIQPLAIILLWLKEPRLWHEDVSAKSLRKFFSSDANEWYSGYCEIAKIVDGK